MLGAELQAEISQYGIKGSVIFHYEQAEKVETESEFLNGNGSSSLGLFIQLNLQTLMDVEPSSYNWAVYDLPVEYTQPIACEKAYLGEKYLTDSTVSRLSPTNHRSIPPG